VMSAGHTSSMPSDQLSQTRLMQQQPHQQLLAAASQPPAGASYLPAPSSSSYLTGSRFGGNGMGGIHLPLGVSHLDPDGYLTNPSQPGLGAPVQTGMGNPGQAGSGGTQQLGLGNPVQTGMGGGLNPSQPTGLYQRPSSAQPFGNRQSMQVQKEDQHHKSIACAKQHNIWQLTHATFWCVLVTVAAWYNVASAVSVSVLSGETVSCEYRLMPAIGRAATWVG